ncbi:MAG TPA: ABC transporter permease [Vicinamibacterales bacterium]|nr:ABC transporter permease [Vicinamibacterales bacterium]
MRHLPHRTTVVTAVLLAVGLGAAASLITVLKALTPAGLPYPDGPRLVVARVGGPSWSPGMLEAVSQTTTVFDRLTGIQERAATLTDDGAGARLAEVVRLESVSADYFELLGVRPALGRPFDRTEDARGGRAPVVLVSDRLWTRWFGRDMAVLGRRIVVDARPLEILGVMPAGFGGLIGRTDLWAPLGSARWLLGDTGPERPTSRWFEVVARLAPGVSPAEAGERFAAEARRAILQIPRGEAIVGPDTRLTIASLAEARSPRTVHRFANVLGLAVIALLTVVVVNVTSLHLMRVDARRSELAIRLALGAGPRHLARLAVREAGGIAITGTTGALALRPIFLAVLNGIQPVPTGFGIVTSQVLTPAARTLDVATVLGVGGLAVLACLPLAAGLLLGVRRMRLQPAMRRQRSTPRGRAGVTPVQAALVTVQAALACAAVGAGVLLARSASELLSADRGYEYRGVTMGRINLPETFDTGRASAFFEDVVARLQRTPGVVQTAAASCAPGEGRCRRSNVEAVDGRALDSSNRPTVGVHFATPGLFATIGAHVANGRAFDASDGPTTSLVAIVSSPLAARLWPGASPIGRTLEVFTADGSLDGARTVIGVVNPIAFDLESDPGLDIFLPASQAAWTSGLVFVSGPSAPGAIARAIKEAVASVDPSVPVFGVGGLDAPLARSLGVESFLRRVLVAFGGMGLLLVAFGAHAVVARVIADRQRELGVRVALGATPAQIGRLVARRGLAIAALGGSVGALGAVWAGHLLGSLLHGLAASDPLSVAAGPLITAAVVLAAVVTPVVRTARMNPMGALRADD